MCVVLYILQVIKSFSCDSPSYVRGVQLYLTVGWQNRYDLSNMSVSPALFRRVSQGFRPEPSNMSASSCFFADAGVNIISPPF